MGLHAHIHQANRDVLIALNGEIKGAEFDQLREILTHFQRRGCQRFVLDFSQIPPLTPAAKASLARLTGQPGFPSLQIRDSSAIRSHADTPAARPQTGCGDLCLSAA
ncbi:MAG: hypothetical protein ACOZB3_05955 [Calditrichota bacterium]